MMVVYSVNFFILYILHIVRMFDSCGWPLITRYGTAPIYFVYGQFAPFRDWNMPESALCSHRPCALVRIINALALLGPAPDMSFDGSLFFFNLTLFLT
jgi:hypothetical protein